MTRVPRAWYNALADVPVDVPPDVPPPAAPVDVAPHVPMSLVRQEMTRRRWIPIPDEVAAEYRRWRPTPLRRATRMERALGTRSRLYYKYEGDNPSGSHKLNTAVAQAFYYRAAGATRLAVGTGAGQWGTAVAAACSSMGLESIVYMVGSSYDAKPYRKTIMEMLGSTVVSSPSERTEIGRRARREGRAGSLSLALAEALEEARSPGTRFCTGSGETYSLLHQTVSGLEAQEQLEDAGDPPDVVVASLGGGSNFGGLSLPFLGELARGERSVRCVSVEPTACPKLTRGRYAYDFTDASQSTPLQKMYTLGHAFAPPDIHAGGLRYHGTAKLLSAMYDEKLFEAVAYPQREVFESATLFARTEGLVPAPESAHAIHGAVVEARQADDARQSRSVLIGLSGHGLFDMAAYQSYLDGSMVDSTASDEQIAASLERLPAQPSES